MCDTPAVKTGQLSRRTDGRTDGTPRSHPHDVGRACMHTYMLCAKVKNPMPVPKPAFPPPPPMANAGNEEMTPFWSPVSAFVVPRGKRCSNASAVWPW